ncbi:MAG: tRNA (guanosine(37)-N1)-methyltransferase TrmD [Patescibacteria group bacterium]|nr:tRNA (guanosine(37)-N1)-methyltransferase TrmD [Patescibacteria group bacterium]
MKFDVITIFPNIFDSYLGESILGRAQKNGLIEINMHDLRDYTSDKHNTVDDTPYGGGVGMVMMIEPIYKALNDIKSGKKTRSILLTPRGKRFTQKKAQELTTYDQITLIAGRYEGVDNRVSELVDEEISIGDFVLNGGELPAMTIIESVSRLIPGVLGKDESSKEESFSDNNTVEYPQYTRPEIFKTGQGNELKVPEILLSGNHSEIEKWRTKQRG